MLLEEFRNSLKQLVKIHKKATMPSMGSDAFRELIANAGLYGYAIQQIIHGLAIKQHLLNITPLLQDHHRTEMDQSMMDMEETDTDLDFLVTPSAGTTASEQPLWESYLDWLRLILSHFNAVENLTSDITNTHYKDLDLKMLISPPMLTTSPTFSLLNLFQQHPYLLPDDTDEVNMDKVKDKDKDGNGD